MPLNGSLLAFSLYLPRFAHCLYGGKAWDIAGPLFCQLNSNHFNDRIDTMTHASQKVLLSLGTPFMTGAARATFESNTRLLECVQQISAREPGYDPERRIVHQIRRELAGTRFDILVTLEDGAIRRVDPETPIGDIASNRDVQTPDGSRKHLVVLAEVQAYAPVAA